MPTPVVTLVVQGGKHAGQQIRLNVNEFLIGRGEQCHLRPRNEAVSRQHCGIFVQAGRVLVKDFDSKNGTYVNGQRIVGEVEIHDGDILQVADLRFQIRLTTESQPTPAAVQPTRAAIAAKSAPTPAPAVTAGNGAPTQEIDLTSLFGPPDLSSSPTRAFDPASQSLQDTMIGQAPLDTVPTGPALGSDTGGPPQQAPGEVKIVGVAKDRWKPKYANPREAAADALRKFFGRS
jgi:pSer/pThr/pTyr-binding forkhead associated (FHA) protein